MTTRFFARLAAAAAVSVAVLVPASSGLASAAPASGNTVSVGTSAPNAPTSVASVPPGDCEIWELGDLVAAPNGDIWLCEFHAFNGFIWVRQTV